jgi:predicted cupin superfamily sugar epimerase|tara:strand:+ start:6159 stop:6476 length:318 start_codon:yes stop_codon:yes gene_type:complete
MKTKHYHNTNKLDRVAEKMQAEKNLNQEDIIYLIFKKSTFKKLTPSEVWKYYQGMKNNIPLTSVRRGMSNLMKEGYLIKTNDTQSGLYGKPEHFYKLSQNRLNLS